MAFNSVATESPGTRASLIRGFQPDDAPAIARLHAEQLKEGVLARLGPEFLARFYYRHVPFWPTSCCLVFEHDGQVAGFVAATTAWRTLFGEVARRRWLALTAALLRLTAEGPRRWQACWEAGAFMFRPPRVLDDAPAEVLSLAVAPAFRSTEFVQRTGLRIGHALGQAALAQLEARGARKVRALVRVDNAMAHVLYQHLGFHSVGEVMILGGRSRVYVKELAAHD